MKSHKLPLNVCGASDHTRALFQVVIENVVLRYSESFPVPPPAASSGTVIDGPVRISQWTTSCTDAPRNVGTPSRLPGPHTPGSACKSALSGPVTADTFWRNAG